MEHGLDITIDGRKLTRDEAIAVNGYIVLGMALVTDWPLVKQLTAVHVRAGLSDIMESLLRDNVIVGPEVLADLIADKVLQAKDAQ